MATGTVKWFRKTAGYGFITPDDGGEDVFVHSSAIGNENLHTLTENQPVTYEVKEGPNGPLAINVQT
jgi:CspA family cold shock protein